MNCVICGKPILPGQTYMAPPPADAPWHHPDCPIEGEITKMRLGEPISKERQEYLDKCVADSKKAERSQTEQAGDVTYDAIVDAYMGPFVAVEKFIAAAVKPKAEDVMTRDLLSRVCLQVTGRALDEPKAEQKKTVEQSPNDRERITITPDDVGSLSRVLGDVLDPPPAGGPVSVNVARRCPVCGLPVMPGDPAGCLRYLTKW